MTEFEELAAARVEIREFLTKQERSLAKFKDDTGSYRIMWNEPRLASKRKVQGLTSTFTCLESLIEAGVTADISEARQHLSDYTKQALLAPSTDWLSDNSGWAYCRLRSIGTVARHHPDALAAYEKRLGPLLDPVWDEAAREEAGAYGVREFKAAPGTTPAARNLSFGANAYLTYWALFLASKADPTRPWAINLDGHVRAFSDWMRLSAGEQIAFHEAKSPHADPQQLAWSIAGVVLQSDRADLVRNARTYDLVHQGLRAFFAQQHDRGDWDRGKPLFNYHQAGTAYCYGYETIGELLALATDDTPQAASFASMLLPFAPDLIRAFQYARDTALPLDGQADEVGWGSGHHPGREKPESWATASVYRFTQRLRILVGKWANERAQELLNARAPGTETLDQRGGTWDMGRGSAGVQLASYFVLPQLARSANRKSVTIPDPDEALIVDKEGRAAILFGPPGTGKTTLVEAVAGALGWPFIEVSPAQFLDEGMDRVSARADQIFRHMMELDRCVVLLDEIDELVKRRTNEAEPLERFFTTTMLPRLAQLWKRGKILFFANTNGISDIDAAIQRSQRFDAAILVMPPGDESKAGYLAKERFALDDECRAQIGKVFGDDSAERPDSRLMWFPLMRYDQRELLLARLQAKSKKRGAVSMSQLIEAMDPIGKDLMSQDWSSAIKKDESAIADVLNEVKRLSRSQRRTTLRPVIQLAPGASELLAKADGNVLESTDYFVLKDEPDNLTEWCAERGLALSAGGMATKAV